MEIKGKRIFVLILIAAMLNVMPNSIALTDAQEPLAKDSVSSKLPSGSSLNSRIYRQLNLGGQVFKFQNTECVFESTLGCTVTSSSNQAFPLGYTFSAKVISNLSVGIQPGLNYLRCSWCSFVGETISIVVFVAAASGATPVWLLVGTYVIGTEIILNHA